MPKVCGLADCVTLAITLPAEISCRVTLLPDPEGAKDAVTVPFAPHVLGVLVTDVKETAEFGGHAACALKNSKEKKSRSPKKIDFFISSCYF